MPGSGCRAPPYGDAVRTGPGGLSDGVLAAALHDGWDVQTPAPADAAVGFGSYHWRARAAGAHWFVTADDLELKRRERSEPLDAPRRRLVTALSTARALHDAGLDFVVAPVMTRARTVVHVVGGRFAVALYPHVVGVVHPWGPYPSRRERLAVLDRIVAVHAAPGPARRAAIHDDFVIQQRDDMTDALADDDTIWGPGPFS